MSRVRLTVALWCFICGCCGQQYELLLRSEPFPHSSNTSFISSTLVVTPDESIMPVLAIFVRVGNAFLRRCLWSIDYPVRELAIIQDGEDETEGVKRLLQEFISERKSNTSLSRVEKVRHIINLNHTGCAQAWNTAYYVYPSQPFWILSANDILFLPGQLEIFYKEVIRISNLPDRSVGMLSTCIDFGGGAIRRTFGLMTWATTRKGVLTGGLYDENFYPVYFEDDDILIRYNLTGLELVAVQNATMRHGDKAGVYEYGSVKEDVRGLFKAELGRSRNQHYLAAKWNVKHIQASILENCRLRLPSAEYCTPFNNSIDAASWTFIPAYRKCVEQNLAKDCGSFLPPVKKNLG